MMDSEFINSLSVIDLISEKHKQLRSRLIARVNEALPEPLSDMEIYLLSLSHHSELSVSESSRYMHISRQAAHKHAKRLEAMGYITLDESERSRREKRIKLTDEGKRVYQQVDGLKKGIETETEAAIGPENLEMIKTLFRQVW